MRVAFAGTPDFAARALEALLAAGFTVPLVLTQPDRPAGRGQKLQPSAVKQVAVAHGVPVYQPERLKDPATHRPLVEAEIDVLVVAAYGLILPQAVLDIPRWGCLNIHASLLPRWRGAAPIHRAIEAGDRETGITLMKMDAGLDTGPTLLAEAVPIAADDTTGRLHDTLAALGARLVVDALNRLPQLALTPQPGEGVTYAHKIDKAEALLDWQLPAEVLARKIRAFDPFPGAATGLNGAPLKLWQAVADTDSGTGAAGNPAPGTVLAVTPEAVTVACGEGTLRVLSLQKAGGRRLPVRDFLAGHPLAVGDVLKTPAD